MKEFKKIYNSVLQINLKNIEKNYNYLKKNAPNTIIAACVKADSYGLGSNEICKALYKKNCRDFSFSLYKEMPMAIHKLHSESDDKDLTNSQERSASSADYLGENMGKVPVIMIPCIAGRTDNAESNNVLAQSALYGSIIPAAWSFMLAARARGIGTAWTTLHLMHEKEIAELIGIPYDEFMQIALIPIAYTKGTSFKPAYRPDVEQIMHVDEW